ncbi:V-type proton ATPase 116 kDa subunit a isoform 2 [Symbiodinium microadriaticum]|uniref:V-type proton ATPase subunit a n=1 Tax=Symbiodinium microadriaticum TaxID=2951 RepID=A0A1Q9DA70_SYMMI|nr:V-type proton ATPase 116 kDa subunit a isoform 2 [Symbiodinium microadriaticum]
MTNRACLGRVADELTETETMTGDRLRELIAEYVEIPSKLAAVCTQTILSLNLSTADNVKNEGGPGPYPFGLDWAWHGASNELLYVNSLKMKLSVLFGVLQMTVGLVLRWSNAFYEKNMTDFLCECIPMMIFMLCFFGWMDCMILYKWVHPIDNPPSIINSLICMAMGQEDKFPLWPGSVELAQTLMGYTMLAVPIMLLPKPFVLLYQHNSKQEKGDNLVTIDEETGPSSNHHGCSLNGLASEDGSSVT